MGDPLGGASAPGSRGWWASRARYISNLTARTHVGPIFGRGALRGSASPAWVLLPGKKRGRRWIGREQFPQSEIPKRFWAHRFGCRVQ